MSYIDCSSAKKFGSFHSGANSARIGLHTFYFELNVFLSVVLPEAFQWFTSGSPLPSVSLVRRLNVRATFVLLSYSTSFPGDKLFSLGLKLPSAINIKNLPSEKSSFLRSLWGLEFLRRPCYIRPPLFFATPLCAPAWVCFQHQSDLVFCANPFILIVCPYCCMLRIEWPGGKWNLTPSPTPGGIQISCAWSSLVARWKCLLYTAAFLPDIQWQPCWWGTSAILFVSEPPTEDSDQYKPGIS